MSRSLTKKIIIFIAILLFSTHLPLSYLEANERNSNDNTNEKYPMLFVSLGEEFILHVNQVAKLENDDFEIKIVQFFNSPCPPNVKCLWSGVGVAFEYRHGNEVKQGINLSQAFGYKTTEIESDYETYAKLKLTKID